MVAALGDFEHPDAADVRWTPPSRWHITLVFLGEVATGQGEVATGVGEVVTGEGAVGWDAGAEGPATAHPAGAAGTAVDDAVARLERVPVADHAGTVARMGSVTRSFGRSVLYVPVSGLDALAASVRTAFASITSPPAAVPPAGTPAAEASVGRTSGDPAPFTGHLTLARSRRRRDDLRWLAGSAVGVAGGMAWTVDELALVASISTGGKGRYETVATVSVPGDDHPTSNMRSGLQ